MVSLTNKEKEEELKEKRVVYEFVKEHTEIDLKATIKYPPVCLSYGVFFDDADIERPVPLATYGNIVFVHAPPKTMKTFFLSLLSSAYLKADPRWTKKLKGHSDGRGLLHIDTEQGVWHVSRVARRPYQMGADQEIPYHCHAMRGHTHSDILEFIELYLYNNRNIGCVILDGIADLVIDVNDNVSSNSTVLTLMRLTKEYNVCLITIIHSNYNSNKPTGHLGSFLEKKAEAQLELEWHPTNEGEVRVKCRRSRNTPFDDFNFKLENGLPIIVEYDELLQNLKSP